MEAGIAKGIKAYAGRRRRVAFLRALAAAVAGRFEEAARFASAIGAEHGSTDAAAVIGPVLREYSVANLYICSSEDRAECQ